MKVVRATVVTLVVLAIAGMSVLSRSSRPPLAEASSGRGVVPASNEPGSGGSTWFCSAGRVADGVATNHEVIITNLGSRPVLGRISGYTSDPAKRASRDLQLDPHTVTVVSMADLVPGGVTAAVVEAYNGGVAVEHRLTTSDGFDQGSCVTNAARRWLVPLANTEKDARATLVVFNPFPVGASVSVTLAADVTRLPGDFTGLDVRGGQVREIPLGPTAGRWPVVSVDVASSLPVVVELVQSFDGSGSSDSKVKRTGLALELGRPRATTKVRWVDGFTQGGVTEEAVFYDADRRAQTDLQLATDPYNADEATLAEPFQKTVQSRRFEVITLNNETRVPVSGLHRGVLEAERPVAAALMQVISGKPDETQAGDAPRPNLDSGVSISIGSTVASRTWSIGSVSVDDNGGLWVLIDNPSTESLAVVDLFAIGGGKRTQVKGGAKLEVGPRGQLAVNLGKSEIPAGSTVVVESQVPVVVDRRLVRYDLGDFSSGPALPGRRGLIAVPGFESR